MYHPMQRRKFLTLFIVLLFSVSFALVEAAVVVYLRSLYYPHGFSFPLEILAVNHLIVEVLREIATIVMLSTAAYLAGNARWERVAYFLVAFGAWDCFYYVWLKVILDWPSSLLDWDILFLIPIPWIGPIIAPVLVSLVFIVVGVLILLRLRNGGLIDPGLVPSLLGVGGTAILLWSFLTDTDATLRGNMPAPYRYDLLIIGLLLYGAGFIALTRRSGHTPAQGERSP